MLETLILYIRRSQKTNIRWWNVDFMMKLRIVHGNMLIVNPEASNHIFFLSVLCVQRITTEAHPAIFNVAYHVEKEYKSNIGIKTAESAYWSIINPAGQSYITWLSKPVEMHFHAFFIISVIVFLSHKKAVISFVGNQWSSTETHHTMVQKNKWKKIIWSCRLTFMILKHRDNYNNTRNYPAPRPLLMGSDASAKTPLPMRGAHPSPSED